MGGAIGGIVLGFLVTIVWVARMGRTKPQRHHVAYEAEVCEVKIHIWKIQKNDRESWLADLGGGKLGVSHTSIDLCEQDDDGNSLMVECLPRCGVIRVPTDKYKDRPCATIIIGGHEGSELRGCVRAKIGQPFDRLGMFGGIDNPKAMMCSTLVYQCLSKRLRDIVVPAKPERAFGLVVGPGQLLKAFGAKVGGPLVYVDPA